MSVRARINILWLIMLLVSFWMAWDVFTRSSANEITGASPSAYLWQIALCLLLLSFIVFVDLKRSAIFQRMFTNQTEEGLRNSFIPVLMRPSDSIGERAAIFLFVGASASAAAASYMSYEVFTRGAPRTLTEALCVLAIVCIFFVRWRSHTSWEIELMAASGTRKAASDNDSAAHKPARKRKRGERETPKAEVRPEVEFLSLWGRFIGAVLLTHYYIIVNKPIGMSEVSIPGLLYALMILSVLQTAFIIVYDILSISKHGPVRIRVPSNADQAMINEEVKETRADNLTRAFFICCCVSAASGLYAAAITILGGLSIYTHVFMAFAYAGLFYTIHRIRTRWFRLYFDRP